MRKSILALGLLLLASCGGSASTGGLSNERCVPGAQVRCTCSYGSSGVQVCDTNGREFLACQCGGSLSSGGSASGAGGASSGGKPSSAGASAAGGSGATTSSGLTSPIVDAEYSRTLDRVVLLSSAPAELHVFDPFSNTDVALTLPLDGRAVSVAPDGKRAVVGHDGWVTLVDLVELETLKTVPVTCDALDIVLADNGYAYVFPVRDQWTEIRSVNLETETEEEYTGDPIYAGTLAKLRPGTRTIYGADNGLSPSDIEKYDVSSGAATYLYQAPYHGDYPTCGDLWFSEDGEAIFTRCGNVFNASDSPSDDMTYRGSLGDFGDSPAFRQIVYLTHSAAAHELFVVVRSGRDSSGGSSIQIYEDQYLKLERSVSPSELSGSFVASQCHHVFVDDAARTMVAVCSDGAETQARYGVFTMPL